MLIVKHAQKNLAVVRGKDFQSFLCRLNAEKVVIRGWHCRVPSAWLREQVWTEQAARGAILPVFRRRKKLKRKSLTLFQLVTLFQW